MPTTLHVAPACACVYVSATGRFTDETYVAAFQAVLNHPERDPDFAEVWDFLGLAKLAFTPKVLEVYQRFMLRYKDEGVLTRGRVAVLARQEEVRTMAVLFDQISSKHVEREIKAFVRPADAEAWLGLPEHTFARIRRETPAYVVDPAPGTGSVRRAG